MDNMANDKVANLLKREAERQFELQKKRNDKKEINAEHEQYNYFTKIFKEKLNLIEIWLEEAHSIPQTGIAQHFDKISKEIHSLQKFVSESLLFLRGYDIKVSQNNLQEIENKARKLEEQLLPKKKFGFKNKRTSNKTSDEIKKVIKQNGHDVIDFSKKGIKFDDNYYGFKDKKDAALHLTNDCLLNKDVTLEKLENCVIRLNGNPSTLHMNRLTECIVLCGPVTTSIFVENCQNCKFVIACQQLRLHSSLNCEIYLHVTSKAIIEDCKRIQVTQYNYEYDTLENDYATAKLDRNINHWNNIDDFNWLVVDKHSPNWSLLDEKCKIFDWNMFLPTK